MPVRPRLGQAVTAPLQTVATFSVPFIGQVGTYAYAKCRPSPTPPPFPGWGDGEGRLPEPPNPPEPGSIPTHPLRDSHGGSSVGPGEKPHSAPISNVPRTMPRHLFIAAESPPALPSL